MKLLIVRLSSFGDILQAQACLSTVYKHSPDASVDWLVRSDFAELLKNQPVRKVISLERKNGFLGLLALIWKLSSENYTHIYDAHNNLRSFWIRNLVPLFIVLRRRSLPKVLVRSKNRWRRFLFFKLRRPVFKMPFRGSSSFLEPLRAWGMDPTFLQKPHWQTSAALPMIPPKDYIALAPSAAWATKRWPADLWKKLIELMPQHHFVVLGGPQDAFCKEIADVAPSRVTNWAGKLTLRESTAAVALARLTISGDTGLLHAADQLRVPNIGLIGPTAFGYTSQSTSVILETELSCKPCSKDGRDRCTNAVFQKCLRDISPELVAKTALQILGAP